MDPDTTVELLRKLPFSADLPEKALVQLASVATVQNIPRGKCLFREGEQHCCVYLLASGAVGLDMHVPARGNVRILSLGAGDVLGWSPFFGDAAMTATATTLADTEVIVIPGKALRQLCEADHDVGFQVVRRMAAALSRRLVATRLQLLDVFREQTSTA